MAAEYEVILVVHDGTNLAPKDPNGLSDPYVRIHVRGQDGATLLRKETKVCRKSLSPTWNERFFLKCPLDVRIGLECWDWDRVGDHDFMGQASVSLRELRTGERQLVLEARGKEEVKGSIRVSASFAEGAGSRAMSKGSFVGRSNQLSPTELASVSVDSMGLLAVHRAAYVGDVDALALVISPALLRATCRLSGWTALEYAVHGDLAGAVRLLLDKWCGDNEPHLVAAQALHLAQSEEVAVLLLKCGFSPSLALSPLRDTPLLRACKRGAGGVARVLLEHGAEADAADECGRTALFYAVRAGNLELLVLLLARKLQWSPMLEGALKELVAQKPSVGADATAALRRAGLLLK